MPGLLMAWQHQAGAHTSSYLLVDVDVGLVRGAARCVPAQELHILEDLLDCRTRTELWSAEPPRGCPGPPAPHSHCSSLV